MASCNGSLPSASADKAQGPDDVGDRHGDDDGKEHSPGGRSSHLPVAPDGVYDEGTDDGCREVDGLPDGSGQLVVGPDEEDILRTPDGLAVGRGAPHHSKQQADPDDEGVDEEDDRAVDPRAQVSRWVGDEDVDE